MSLIKSGKFVLTTAISVLLVSAFVYSADITSLNQTAKQGDVLTSQWVNAVNNMSQNEPLALASGGASDWNCTIFPITVTLTNSDYQEICTHPSKNAVCKRNIRPRSTGLYINEFECIGSNKTLEESSLSY